jgi:hypothetical protein
MSEMDIFNASNNARHKGIATDCCSGQGDFVITAFVLWSGNSSSSGRSIEIFCKATTVYIDTIYNYKNTIPDSDYHHVALNCNIQEYLDTLEAGYPSAFVIGASVYK